MRSDNEIRLLLLPILMGALATTVFLAFALAGATQAAHTIGYVAGIGALCDLALTLAAKARKR